MLSRSAKPTRFSRFLTPDAALPTIDAADSAPPELLRKARKVIGSFSWVTPEQRPVYELKWVSSAALEDLGLQLDTENPEATKEFAQILSGYRHVIDRERSLYPYATNYAGDQFGSWAGQLGDGRAITLFKIGSYEIQLKGAGLTPYSRFADGKAVLRSSIREALCSEYMHKLGIPTQRCLSLVTLSETFAQRERIESCAVIARMAQTWVRVGSFQLHHSRGDRSELRKLADYCISELGLGADDNTSAGNRYFKLFRDSALRNAKMMAKCQAYGFLNGVLNTDNVSILGLSIDYGPYAFMDVFEAQYTPNHDDHMRRYGFQSAPVVMWWNMVKLGETLGELIGAGNDVDAASFVAGGFTTTAESQAAYERATKLILGVGEEFEELYESEYEKLMMRRLGIFNSEARGDTKLVEELLLTMQECEIDYNAFFRKLSNKTHMGSDGEVDPKRILPEVRERKLMLSDADAAKMVKDWFKKYESRLSEDAVSDFDRRREMKAINPNFVLRNSVLANVIDLAELGNWDAFHAVAKMALSPFADRWEGAADRYVERYLGEVDLSDRDTQLSCSS